MTAKDTGVPKQWNDAHVGVRNKPHKGFLSFQSICIDAGHVSENAKLSSLIYLMYKRTLWYPYFSKPSDPNCFDSLFNFSLFASIPPELGYIKKMHFIHSNGYRNIYYIYLKD